MQQGDSGVIGASGDRALINAYNIPMGGGPQTIEPVKAVPGTQVWEGEVFGTSSGGHYHETPTERSYYFQPSEFAVRAAHPFNRKTFSIVVGKSVIDFCGVNKEVKDPDIVELNYHYVRLTTSAGVLRLHSSPYLGSVVTMTKSCYLLEDIEDFTERKEFTGFIAPSSGTVLRIVRSIDRFYGGKYKGGQWKLSRTDTIESGKYRVSYAVPGDDQYRFVWDTNLKTGEFIPITRCAEEVEQFIHERGL